MAGNQSKKSGHVKLSDFQTPSYLQKLEPVVQCFRRKYENSAIDAPGLGMLIARLLEFMETVLGKEAHASDLPMKLPVKPLWNFAENGPLYWLMCVAHEFQTERDWMPDDFESEEWFPRMQCLEFIEAVRSKWEERQCYRPFKFYLDYSLGEQLSNELQGILEKLGADLAGSVDEDGVTHHVIPFGPDGDPDDGNQYLRALERADGKSRVHWWYLPDSYDEWIPDKLAPENLEPDSVPSKAWQVYVRYVYDSEKFNEWMNPIDYEPEEAVEADRGAAFRGEAGGVGRSGFKKRQREVPEGVEIIPGRDTVVGEGVTRHEVGTPYSRAMDGTARTQNLSQGQENQPPSGLDPLAAPGAVFSRPVTKSRRAATSAQAADAPKVELVEVHRVPAHSSWFRWNKIDDIERRSVPEYFNGRNPSKTPKTYKEIRDFIINLFRQNKTRKLSFTECRKMLAGDVNSLHRIWTFLDHWGLINFLPSDEQPPKPLPVIQAAGMPAGTRVIAAPAAPANLFGFKNPTPQEAATAASTGGSLATIITRPDRYGYTAATPTSKQRNQFFCNADTSHDCTRVRYHCIKMSDVDICPECYADGRLPIGMTTRDFIRIDNLGPEGEPSADWTEQETLLLLEALEVYNDNWADIAEHVGTKSQVQCITHFLQLPIEDQFLDDMETSSLGAAAGIEGQPGVGEAIPFADAGNPIMAQVAFLTSMIGPRVAAAAASKALEVLAEEEPESAEEEAGAINTGEPVEHEDPEAPTDRMDIDGEQGGASTSAPAAGGAQGDSQGKEGETPISDAKVKTAAATALAAAAVKAKLLADQEEREIQRLVVGVIQNQVEKLEVKMRYFEELEATLEKERGALENAWTSLFVERTQLAQAQLTTPPPTSTPSGVAGHVSSTPMQTPATNRYGPPGYPPSTGLQGGVETPGPQPNSAYRQQQY